MNKEPANIETDRESIWVEHGYGHRFQGFQNLMRLRIRDILLVSSLYDLYLFEEDGKLYELIRNEYRGLNLSHSPELTRVSSGREAIAIAKEEKRFDLIITTLHIEDLNAAEFAQMAKDAGVTIPIVLLAHDNKELQNLTKNYDINVFERIFIWMGDFRIIVGIIKHLEDKLNLENDTRIVGVQNIIVIEDNPRYYSSFLHIIYTELLKQSNRLISEGINLSHKFLRMRARPKIILCQNFEEAWIYFEKYKDFILGIISDVEFPKEGKIEPEAGINFAKKVKAEMPDIPVLLLSQNKNFEESALSVANSFIQKDSSLLLDELRQFMNTYFSFGDFVFRDFEGNEVGRATNLKQLEDHLKTAPESSIRYHAERNHFSNWLKARTEFDLAHRLRPRKVPDYHNVEELRKDLISSLNSYRTMRQRGIISDFNKEAFDPKSSFARIGGGSLGGKARGLGFVNTLINDYNIRNRFNDVQIFIPSAIVIATGVFDQFLDENNLRKFAMESDDDIEITKRFIEADRFPEDILGELAAFLDTIKEPLAVRSSSLLEDSQYHPFAGVYETYMIPNNQTNSLIRLNDLLNAIKKVYASTFYRSAKRYINITSYRLEEEKMAVIVQKMIGVKHQNRYYPDFSGVAKSYNFYPLHPQKPGDGIVSAALGLGKTVVDGGSTVRFVPKYSQDIVQFYSTKETLQNSQTKFYALQLDLKGDFGNETYDTLVKKYNLKTAEEDGSLKFVGSTFSPENDMIYEGLSRPGPRVVSFSPILKSKIFPLPNILELILDMGSWGMGTPIEIEFAVNMSVPPGAPKEFALLQLRPLVVSHEKEDLNIEEHSDDQLICRSEKTLGHGIIEDIYDIVLVDYDEFERSKSRKVADEVSQYNAQLVKEEKPYLLIGVGRWGSQDPWLGIPVKWEEIAGAKAIVEASFKDISVEPSQGSHFFQNITSFMIGYFTINSFKNDGFLNWDWLLNKEAKEKKKYTRHLQFNNPIVAKMDGHNNIGIILKPESED